MLQKYNEIGDRGLECIAEGLKFNSSLKKLDLVSFFHYLMYDGLSFAFVLRERARRGRAAV